MRALQAIALTLAGLTAVSLPLRSATYKGEGLVLSVDPPQNRITISHREIAGYMPAMAMPFNIAKGENLAKLKPGTRVTFDLIVSQSGVKLRHIKTLEQSPLPGLALADPPLEKEVQPGEVVPAWKGIDQQGNAFDSTALRGHVVVVDFIYTRCPIADACPRLSANFAYLQKRFGDRVELVSITLDPQWDTPAVLAGYGKRWAGNPAHWHFVTGDKTQLRRVAESFGVRYWVEEDAIAHSSSVGIMTPDGRLAARVDGTFYPVRELADLVETQLGTQHVR